MSDEKEVTVRIKGTFDIYFDGINLFELTLDQIDDLMRPSLEVICDALSGKIPA